NYSPGDLGGFLYPRCTGFYTMTLIRTLLISWIAVHSAPAFADALVLRVEGPLTNSVGSVLKAGSRLEIPPNGMLWAVGSTGRMLIIRGPYNGVLERPQPSEERGGFFAKLLEKLGLAEVINATRGATGPTAVSDSWAIDLQTGGKKCVPNIFNVEIRRSAPL